MKDTLKLSANVRMGRGLEDKLLAYFEENVRDSTTKQDRFFWTDRISELLKKQETQELSNEIVLWLMKGVDLDSEIANPEMESETQRRSREAFVAEIKPLIIEEQKVFEKKLGFPSAGLDIIAEKIKGLEEKISTPKLEDFVISKWTAQDVRDEVWLEDFASKLSDEQILEIAARLRNGTAEVTSQVIHDEIDNYISELEEGSSHES